LTQTKRKKLFNGIANRYDLANHILSAGTDIRWRKIAARLTNPDTNDKVLDMCCGTGDLAISFAKLVPTPAEIIGLDFSEEMINHAGVKYTSSSKNRNYETKIRFSVQDCTSTNFADASFDIISCGFGIRNFTDLDKGLNEMARLLKTNGKTCIIEFSLPKIGFLRLLYLAYFKYILPILGGIITGDFSAYRYFVKSVIDWDKNINLTEKLTRHGFEILTIKPLTFGIATIYISQKT
jgi:demethylmenaquinone methyltransferase / 2-methoxy-6-polyprenyl-1,4-benzoquinol methylase